LDVLNDEISPDRLADQAMNFAAAGVACLGFLFCYIVLPRFLVEMNFLRRLPRNAVLLALLGAPILAIAGIRRGARALRTGTSKRGKAIAASWLGAVTLTVGVIAIALVVAFVYLISRSSWTF
jgi:hypothetical protein